MTKDKHVKKKKKPKIKQQKKQPKKKKKSKEQLEREERRRREEEQRRLEEEARQEEEERQRREARREKRRELVKAYKAQDETGKQTVGGSTIPCRKAKAGIEVTLESDDRDIDTATIEFSAGGESLEKPTKELKAFLPLKAAGEVSYKGKVSKPENAFELVEVEDKADVPEDTLVQKALQFETKKCELRVKAHEKGTGTILEEAKVKVGKRKRQPVGDDGYVFKKLYKESYDVQAFVDEVEYFKPDVIQARKIDPGKVDDEVDIEVTPRPWIKVKVYDEKKKADMKDVSVFLSFPEEMEGDGATGDDGVVDFRLDKPVADDAKAKLEELFIDEPDEGEGPSVYEFVSHEES